MEFKKLSNIVALAVEEVKAITFKNGDKSDIYMRVEKAFREAIAKQLPEKFSVKNSDISWKADAYRHAVILKEGYSAQCGVYITIKLKQSGSSRTWGGSKVQYNVKDIIFNEPENGTFQNELDEIFDILELCHQKQKNGSISYLEMEKNKCITEMEAVIKAMKNNEPLPEGIYDGTFKWHIQNYNKLLTLKGGN